MIGCDEVGHNTRLYNIDVPGVVPTSLRMSDSSPRVETLLGALGWHVYCVGYLAHEASWAGQADIVVLRQSMDEESLWILRREDLVAELEAAHRRLVNAMLERHQAERAARRDYLLAMACDAEARLSKAGVSPKAKQRALRHLPQGALFV